MHKKILKLLMILPGFLILGFLLSRVSIHDILAILKNINIPLFLFAVLLFFPMIACKTLRWSLILHNLHIKVSFNKLFKLSMLGFFAGVATPGQAGDFIKVWHLKKGGFSLKKSLLSILVDRSIDFILLAVFAVFGVFYFINILTSKHTITLFVLLGFMIFFCLLIWFFYIKRKSMLSHPLSKKLLKLFLKPETIDQLENIRHVPAGTAFWVQLVLISILQILILFFRLYILALSLNIDISFLLFSCTISIVILIQLIPITIEGIGLRDAALVYFFHHLGYSQEAALSLSLIMLLTRIINTLPGFILWIKNPPEKMHPGVIIDNISIFERFLMCIKSYPESNKKN